MKISLLSGVLALAISVGAAAESGKGLLKEQYGRPGVAESFVAGADWFPMPAYADRAGWAALFGDRAEWFIRRGEKALEHSWTHIPASAYLAFEREGDRGAMERIEGGNRGAMISLLMAELAEGKGRFIGHLADAAWFSTEQTSWVLSAHQPRQRSERALPDAREHLIDLASGRTGAIMALIYHYFHEEFDKIDPSISAALERAVRRNILDPFLDEAERKANWWMGKSGKEKVLNNWTPWCTSDVALAFLLMERNQQRLDEALVLSMEAVDAWLDYIAPDGACEEGPNYWDAAAGKLYDFLQILYDASGGKFDLYGNDRIRRMGTFLSRSYIGDRWVVNFADGSARLNTPLMLGWAYGHNLGSSEMEHFALYNMASPRSGRFELPGLATGEAYRTLTAVRYRPAVAAQLDSLNGRVELLSSSDGQGVSRQEALDSVLRGLREDVPSTTWYPETELAFLRNDAGWFLGAKGGHNNESHNHNDIGSFVLYAHNRPVVVDAGVGTYTRQTFSKDRYQIWSMQCQWHNLPMPNGVEQLYGKQYKAEKASCDEKKGIFSLELAGAYPEEALIRSWVRTYRLSMQGRPSLTITDRFALKQRKDADRVHFLVQGAVQLPGEEHAGRPVPAGTLWILTKDGPAIRLTFPKGMTASVEDKELDDTRLSSVWGPSLCRITLLSSTTAPAKGTYTYVLDSPAAP